MSEDYIDVILPGFHRTPVTVERFIELYELGCITTDGHVTVAGAKWLISLVEGPACVHCGAPLSDDEGTSWPYCAGCEWCPDCGVTHPAPRRPSFKCPRCGRTTYHPKDIVEGYCGACHDWTRVSS